MNIKEQILKVATELINPLDGKSNDQARKIVGNIMRKSLTKTFYTDTYWQGINEIFNGLRKSNIDFDIVSNQYSSDMTYKTWKITVNFINKNGKPTILHGTITAHGAGSVKQPLDRYDVTALIF